MKGNKVTIVIHVNNKFDFFFQILSVQSQKKTFIECSSSILSFTRESLFKNHTN